MLKAESAPLPVFEVLPLNSESRLETAKLRLNEKWQGRDYTLAHKLVHEVGSYFESEEDQRKIIDAIDFTLEKFEGKKRGSGSPKGLHSVEVSLLLMGFLIKDSLKPIQNDEQAKNIFEAKVHPKFQEKFKPPVEDIIAGLLHDTIEEELATSEEIRDHFGEVVLAKVLNVTYLKSKELTKDQLRERVESVLKDDPGSFNIKICDLVSNIMTLYDLQGKKDEFGEWTETPEEQIFRKSKEYFEFAPLVLELRHELYSDLFCDKALRYADEKSFFNITVDQILNRETDKLNQELIEEFKKNIKQINPRLWKCIRDAEFEKPGAYRIFERLNKHEFKDNLAYASTLRVFPKTVEDLKRIADLIREYSFDRGVSNRNEITLSSAGNFPEKVEFLIPMASGNDIRIILVNPNDDYMFKGFLDVCYGGEPQILEQFKDRYKLFFKLFGGEVGKYSGRNLSRVKVDTDLRGSFDILLPRRSTVLDAYIQICKFLDMTPNILPHMEMEESHEFVFEPEQVVFGRQRVLVKFSELVGLDPSCALYMNSKLGRTKNYLAELAMGRIKRNPYNFELRSILVEALKESKLKVNNFTPEMKKSISSAIRKNTRQLNQLTSRRIE